MSMVEMLFPLGNLYATPSCTEELSEQDIKAALDRYIRGDWGDVCDEDKVLNDEAIKLGNRILAAYQSSSGQKFWIITEADRSATTILFPEEY